MPRQIDEYKTHQLPDVSEESEYDLWSDRFGSWIGRSSKSRSPDSLKHLRYDRKSSSGVSSASPDFFEATGRRSSSDHGHDLTIDTDSFMIGNRVFVGGVRPGRITFIGEVHFAPGEWAGVVLDEPEGKNDGAVSGKRYFQCEPKKGIFSRLTRLTREPIGSSTTPDGFSSMDTSFRSMTSPGRSGTTSPTYSVNSTSKTAFGTKASNNLEINDRVIVKSATGSRVGTLRYIGEPQFASGVWCGVEFKDAAGKNDGSVGGVRYFKCEPNHGIFVQRAKVALSPIDRKSRLSHGGSQESLSSNLTTGSFASTNTSKLRSSATQKRLSSLNKSPAAMSTPKPSFSLQDILREKSTHIDQLLKEREGDRDDMQTQSMLYQKNCSLYKDKIALLESQLAEEKRKSELLQFRVEETDAENAENGETIQKLKERIWHLDKDLLAAQDGGGDVLAPAQMEEIKRLSEQLEETSKKLQETEVLKKTSENEVQLLNERIVEIRNDLEMKTSGATASEACLKDEINYLEKRVNDLEVELGEKTKIVETKDEEMKNLENVKKQELKNLESRIEDKETNEMNLMEKILSKDGEIEKLQKHVESLTNSDLGIKEVLREKDGEIQKLIKNEAAVKDKLQKKETELQNFQEALVKTQLELEILQTYSDSKDEELREKINANEKLVKDHEVLLSEVSVLRVEVERFHHSLKDTSSSLLLSQEIEKNLKYQINELVESKAKLESEVAGKEASLKETVEKVHEVEKEIEERDKCIAGLEAEVQSINQRIDEKESKIVQFTEDLNAKDEKYLQDLEKLNQELEAAKRTHEEELEKFKAFSEQAKSKIEELTKIGKEKDSTIEKNEKTAALLSELKAALDEKLLVKENELKELMTKLNKAEREDAEKVTQIEKLTKSIEEGVKKLQEAEIISKTLQDEKHALEVDRNDLNRRLGAHEEKVAQLVEQKTKLQHDLETAQSSTMDINSEVSKLSIELRASQEAYESFQSAAEAEKYNLQRRVDELERQHGLVDQQNSKLRNEMEALQTQKIESENQLNQELQNIKQSSDEEKTELEKELRGLRSSFEDAKLVLTREKQGIQEAFEKSQEELGNKIRDLESSISGLEKELEAARNSARQNESSMGSVVSDLKKKEAELTAELDGQRQQSDELKKSLEQVEASKEMSKNEYEEKLSLNRNKISKLEEDLKKLEEQQKLALAGTEEKVKIVDDMRAKVCEQEKSIMDLAHQLENEKSMKTKLEAKIEESSQRYRELEEDQIDLANRKEQLKAETAELQAKINKMSALYKALDEKLALEQKSSTELKVSSDEKVKQMEKKIDELRLAISTVSQNKDSVIEKLHLREEEILMLQQAMKSFEDKMQRECDEYNNLLKGKDQELLKTLHESTTKDNLIADLKTNLENIQLCLTSSSSEKNLTDETIGKLHTVISERDLTIDELKQQVYSVEKINKEISDQLKNLTDSNMKQASMTDLQIADLMEQLALFEEVKSKEVNELSKKCSQYESQLSVYGNATETSNSSLRMSQNNEAELQKHIKDLEIKETELIILNRSLTRRVEELEEMKGIPRAGDAYDEEMQAHIEFLNSIISDMHKKNQQLTNQVEVLVAGPSAESSALDFNFMKKKKPAPRSYCDICEVFDAHETEDCPVQCSQTDLPAQPKSKKDRKLPPPRMFCDNCDEFDLHDTDDCTGPEDETF